MKINHINIYHLRMPLRAPFATSFGSIHTRDCLLIEAFAGDLVGYGECVADRDPGYAYETSKSALHILQDFLIPAVLEQEITSPADFQHRVSLVRGNPMAKAGLEMVYWDLWGKIAGKSLKDMLGGERNCVDVGVSVGLQSSPEKLVNTIGEYLAQGYQRVKIKIKPGRDVGDTLAVRQTYPNMSLQVDANSAYTLENHPDERFKATMLLPLDDLNLLLIEQPLAEDDLWDHSKLQKQFTTPLCLDESIISPRHARQAIEMDACKIINIKQGRVGGLSQAVAIHDLCMTQGIPVWCGGMLETGVGRAANLALASLPNFSLPGDISATERYYAEDITDQCFTLNADSTIRVPTSPGLGVTISQSSLERFTINSLTVP